MNKFAAILLIVLEQMERKTSTIFTFYCNPTSIIKLSISTG